MEAERESNQRLYDSKEKRKVREEIIAKAIHCLTEGRSTSVCINRDYLGDLLKQLQANGTLLSERIQSLTKSLEIHTNITEKDPNQLKVCFLAGDYPLEDVKVFVNNGVLDNNIWVFEKDPKIALKAKEAIKQSGEYRGIKFYAVDIITFFENYDQSFDIIYFDACGPLPAHRQKTLKAILSIFQLNKLESPGALITNFSFPPEELVEVEERKQITFVAKEYLKQKLDTTLHQKTDEEIYSDYITHQIIDLASLLGPASRILRPKKWEEILIPQVRTFFETVRKHLRNSNDSTSDDLDSEAMKAVVNNFYLTKICRAMKKEDEITSNPLCKAWLREVFPHSKGPSQGLDICELLQTSLLFSSFTFFSKFANNATQEFLQPASRDEDKELMAGIVLGALAEPYYPVMDKLLRLKYTQSDKKETCKRQMFCDVFIFDRCSYLFDLPPTVSIAGQFCDDDDDDFLMSKMLLDGMRRQLKCLCKTGILQIDFRRQFGPSETDGNDEELCMCLPERKIIE